MQRNRIFKVFIPRIPKTNRNSQPTLFNGKFAFLLTFLVFALLITSATSASAQGAPPYPASPVIETITWDWSTLSQAAPGSDLWPVTWADDGNLYTSWGDGGGFGGDNNDGRVGMGVARLEGLPQSYLGVNVNGGQNPQHLASFPSSGKTLGLLSVNGVLYSWVNLQDSSVPDFKLAWSADHGATWQLSSWSFASSAFAPATFLNFGKDYAGARDGFVYFYGGEWGDSSKDLYLVRAAKGQLKDPNAYEYFAGLDASGNPTWSPDSGSRQPVFTDPDSVEFNGSMKAQVVFNPGINRYLLTMFHGGPGKLGVFDGPEPWGPWTTVVYVDDFGGMTSGGEGLSSSFPTKWMSADGLTMWNVFSMWGSGAQQGITGHDRFNLVQTTLTLKAGLPFNQPPRADAGANVNISLSNGAILNGTVSDDGLPSGQLSARWSKVSGPGSVSFANADAVNTTAIFSVAGVYALRLTADDGELTDSDDVTVTVGTVNDAPSVNAGQDQDVTLASPVTASLAGVVSDDGLPSGQLSVEWSKVSGPGAVTFGNPAADTTATFTVAGDYLLRLTANDGSLSTADDLTVTVNPPASSGLEVSIVRVASGKPYEVVETGLASGAPVYIDRSYTFTTIPASLEGSIYIKTANNDKSNTQEDFLTLSVNQDVTVYVAYDQRARSLPNWLSEWTDTGEVVRTTDVGRRLFAKDFVAGAITLGGNRAAGASGADSNYNVIVVGQGTATPPGPTPTPPPPSNDAPSVNAGQDQDVTLASPVTASLAGVVSDDGLPSGQLSVAWSKVSGPGAVTFGNPAADTTATFTVAGDYLLRLTANDGSLSTADDLTVTVNPPASPDLEVSIVKVASGKPYEVVEKGLASGAPVYIDRSYTFTGIPSNLSDSTYIKTANDDKSNTREDFLTLSVNQDVTVYVAYDQRARSLPNWLSGWNSTGAKVGTTDVGRNLFSKDFVAGTITLGGNRAAGASGADSNYNVIVVGRGTSTPPGPTPTPPPPSNDAPSVNAGQDQDLTLASPVTAALAAVVSDDGLPSGQLSVAWSKVSGPGAVTFDNPAAVDTTATFTVAGDYLLRLTADDGNLSTADDLTVTVNPANQTPIVNAGPDATISLSAGASLDGSVSDDGLPSGQLSVVWSKVSGPGAVTFGNPAAVDTTATFSLTGAYVLRLSADDGDLQANDEVTITVNPDPNQVLEVSILSVASGKPYEVVKDGLVSGAPVYIDRPYTFTTIPANLSGSTYIKTANDDKNNAQVNFLTLSVNQGVTVYVAYDQRVNSRPNWLSGWANTGAMLGTTDVGRNLFSKDFVAGTFTLGGNAAAGASGTESNYNVIVVGQGTSTPPGPTPTPTPPGPTPTPPPPTPTPPPPSGNQRPAVNAGGDAGVILPARASLNGAVSDDGRPNPPGAVTVRWSEVSGPGTVNFGSPSAVDTTAAFSSAGTYVLRLTADDGGLTASDDVTITATVPSSNSTIQLNPNIKYQTIVGWEATASIGHIDFPNDFQRWRDEVADRAVNEIGINRLRLETHQGYDAVEKANDNNDPLAINWSGFTFTAFDKKIDHIVLPVRQRLQANGEKLYVNLNTVDIAHSRIDRFHINPDEFAEFVLAHFIHMRDKYGFVPDAVEMSLEPDWFDTFDKDGAKIGAALVVTGDRLKANGFTNVDFIAPSGSGTASSIQLFDQMIQTPRVKEYLTEFAYHRYSAATPVSQIASRARQHGIATSMLEHIGADYNELHEDLKVANNVAWAQFTLAYPGSDNGARYYNISNPSNPTVTMGSRTKFLRQYFKFIRAEAQRIEATSNASNFDPVAFINANGKYVVVVKASGGGSFSIGGLPAGAYGIKYTTSSEYNVDLSDAVISNGQSLTGSIPDRGVVTIYGK